MAEAAVEDRPLRFFCHVCDVEVQSVSSEYTCPLCSGGFIEELPAAAATTSAENSSSNDIEMDDLDFLATLSSFLARDGGRPPDAVNTDDSTTNFFSNSGNTSTANGSWTRHGRGNINNDYTTGTGRRPRRGRLPNFERFDNVLLEILHTLSGGSDGSLGNASMFFMGNPGDYAWGREGIDTIVTQLLNQMDTTGPPPLPKEKIDEIPKVEVTKEQVNIKLQCSVCWEDFKLEEIVRKLPCLHLYHENCIVPWLELHGTCPICRKSLTHETKDMGSNARGASSENSNLLGGRESAEGNSADSNSNAVELSLISNATGNNRNNAGSINSSGSRRLHISLPRFTLFGQSDANRSAPNSFNYDLSVNNTQTNNSNPNGSITRPETITNEMQSRRTSTPSTSSFGIEQDNYNKVSGSSSSTSNKGQNDSSNTNNSGSVNNLLKSKETSINLNAEGNCNSNHTATTSTSITPATSTSNSAPQNDIYKFDDGQVDYEFD
ncbi:E3 ubiquitin-protein ligase Iruka isoform X2 [Condylostylus longicornis]|uniref:E3 ubiquitin-protein ligase Iruka isoform X2 n=1 Tax=Condylostylus longicornis TaxID=2530218 RepID=UPI00244DEE48|nr:E3 ubiquitin-protein ligase Iruka isoform X2 [Condylostylus longicornis]